MCNNLIVLYIFMFFKVLAVLILPISIYILRKKEFVKYILATDILLLVFFSICNIFTINKCVYNSNTLGIERTKNENTILIYNKMHPSKMVATKNDSEPDKSYKTFTGKNLYYFNQNSNNLRNMSSSYEDNKVYFDTFGNGITTISISYSTLYDRNINPVEMYNYMKIRLNFSNRKVTLSDIYSTMSSKYPNMDLKEISINDVDKSVKEGNIVVAELSANENSKLTCDSGYIIIYNIDSNGKYMIADPALPSKSYVCPYSSSAYGNVISSDNMKKSWNLQEIDNETIHYYLIKKVRI